MKEKRLTAAGVVLLALGLLLLIGAGTFLRPCEHDDGAVSTCYWAGRMIRGLGAVLSAQALGFVIFRRASARCALALSMIPVTILSILTPGGLIRLCLMDSMRCNSIMKPGVMVISFIMLAAAAAAAVTEGMRAAKERRERHES
ncbi:MAG: DUF4418 family protein [Clostridia bacterium]|nr:DUF4418 family protein [Clostridia bacterium]